MEKLIVIVFDNQTKAFAGFEVLRQLDRAADIVLYQAQLIAKEPGGIQEIDITDKETLPAIGSFAAMGVIVGLLGGPPGALIGGLAGGLIASIVEVEHHGVTDELIDDVNSVMTPGKFAVIADILEDSVTPLDTRMEELGGVVFRRTREEVKRWHHDRDVAAHRAEIEQLKAERAQARSERQARIDARIDALRKKLESALERERRTMQLREKERDAKVELLKTKANQSEGEIRQRLIARIAEVRRDYEKRAAAG